MPAIPLIAHQQPDATVAFRGSERISAARFLRDVDRLAQRLPSSTHILNACTDRYRFAVALAAGLVAGKCSVLPSTHTPEVIRHLREFAADVFCLTDDAACAIDLPQLQFPDAALDAEAAPASWTVPQIDAQQLTAYIFTSGSTGTPMPHSKRFGALVQSVRAEAARLFGVERHARALLGTVPAQHMYGFESTVLLPLHSGHALCAGRPFYPADVIAALQALPAGRVLFTTPVHLRALLGSELQLPPLELIVSATAMLPANLARDVEARFDAPLLEIYGSTETGQIATRRTAREEQWHLWPGVRLQIEAERCWAQGGHVSERTPLADVLESTGEDRFLLHGRTADLVNIAGKRSSLSYLNHQLNAIPGVLDGAFFIREDSDASLSGVTRLAALVVAPTLDAARITQALRERIDAVFLPRPLLTVPEIPRNATGKLVQQTLRALASQAELRTRDMLA